MIAGALKSKTMGFALALELLVLIQQNTDVLTPYLTPDGIAIVVSVIGVAVALLRMLTKKPLSEK